MLVRIIKPLDVLILYDYLNPFAALSFIFYYNTIFCFHSRCQAGYFYLCILYLLCYCRTVIDLQSIPLSSLLDSY